MILALLLYSGVIDYPEAESAAEAVKTCQAAMVDNKCGVKLDGTTLELKNDGSGEISVTSLDGSTIWAFSCHFDKLESIKTCTLSQEGLSIGRMTGTVSATIVTWGGTKFPGSDKVAKIGNHAPMRWDADRTITGKDAVRLIEAGKKGGTGIFRWYDWPMQTQHDTEVNFEKFQLCGKFSRKPRAKAMKTEEPISNLKVANTDANYRACELDALAEEFYADPYGWDKKHGVAARQAWNDQLADLQNHPLWGTF